MSESMTSSEVIHTSRSKTDTESVKLVDIQQPWSKVKTMIENHIQMADPYSYCITLYHCLETVHLMKHTSTIRCFEHYEMCSGAQSFLVHFRGGQGEQLSYWRFNPTALIETMHHKRFDAPKTYTCLIYIKSHRVYVGSTTDLTMHVFNDSSTNFLERCSFRIAYKIYCMAFTEEKNELIGGAIGRLFHWSLKNIGNNVVPKLIGRYRTSIDPEDWVHTLMIDRHNCEIIALMGVHISIVNYYTYKEVHFVNSHHTADMTSCVVYFSGGYLITASRDTLIKVWNRANFMAVHEFVGHNDVVTDLRIHPKDPFLYSCSLDRYIHIWRLDTFQKYMSLQVDEPILKMCLLSEGYLFVQHETSINFCRVNEFFSLFDILSSSPLKIKRLSFPQSASGKIFVATEDGSLRVVSPVTGETITMMYPLPSFLVMNHFAYNPLLGLIYVIVGHGDVLVLDCTLNPCVSKERWRMIDDEEIITCMCHVPCEAYHDNQYTEALFFCGHTNGYISLLKSTHYTMPKRVSAHRSPLTQLIDASIESSAIQDINLQGHRLLSAADGSVCIWQVVLEIESKSVELINTHHLRLQRLPINDVAVIDRFIAVHFQMKRTLAIFKLEKRQKSKGHCFKEIMFKDISMEHTNNVTGLDSCAAASLFVTCSIDGFVKFWDTSNNMVRELAFGRPILSTCFANTRGDVLVGYDKYIMFVSMVKYMPNYIHETLLEKNFQDDQRESRIQMTSQLSGDELVDEMQKKKIDVYNMVITREGQIAWTLQQKGHAMSSRFKYVDLEVISAKVLNYYRHLHKPLTTLTPINKWSLKKAGMTIINIHKLHTALNDLVLKKEQRKSTDEIAAVKSSVEQIPVKCTALPRMLNAEFSQLYRERTRAKNVTGVEGFGVAKHYTDALDTSKDVKAYMTCLPVDSEDELNRKYPIAPDGYIPNSVIREFFQYTRTKAKEKKKFSLKYLPSREGRIARLKALFPSVIFSEESLIKLGSPKSTLSPWLFPLPQKEDVKTTVSKVMEPPVKTVKKLADCLENLLLCPWFMRTSDIRNFVSIMDDLIRLLANIKDVNIHRNICESLAEINRQLGLPKKYVLQISHYMDIQIKSSNPRMRFSCRELMTELGLDWKKHAKAVTPFSTPLKGEVMTDEQLGALGLKFTARTFVAGGWDKQGKRIVNYRHLWMAAIECIMAAASISRKNKIGLFDIVKLMKPRLRAMALCKNKVPPGIGQIDGVVKVDRPQGDFERRRKPLIQYPLQLKQKHPYKLLKRQSRFNAQSESLLFFTRTNIDDITKFQPVLDEEGRANVTGMVDMIASSLKEAFANMKLYLGCIDDEMAEPEMLPEAVPDSQSILPSSSPELFASPTGGKVFKKKYHMFTADTARFRKVRSHRKGPEVKDKMNQLRSTLAQIERNEPLSTPDAPDREDVLSDTSQLCDISLILMDTLDELLDSTSDVSEAITFGSFDNLADLCTFISNLSEPDSIVMNLKSMVDLVTDLKSKVVETRKEKRKDARLSICQPIDEEMMPHKDESLEGMKKLEAQFTPSEIEWILATKLATSSKDDMVSIVTNLVGMGATMSDVYAAILPNLIDSEGISRQPGSMVGDSEQLIDFISQGLKSSQDFHDILNDYELKMKQRVSDTPAHLVDSLHLFEEDGAEPQGLGVTSSLDLIEATSSTRWWDAMYPHLPAVTALDHERDEMKGQKMEVIATRVTRDATQPERKSITSVETVISPQYDRGLRHRTPSKVLQLFNMARRKVSVSSSDVMLRKLYRKQKQQHVVRPYPHTEPPQLISLAFEANIETDPSEYTALIQTYRNRHYRDESVCRSIASQAALPEDLNRIEEKSTEDEELLETTTTQIQPQPCVGLPPMSLSMTSHRPTLKDDYRHRTRSSDPRLLESIYCPIPTMPFIPSKPLSPGMLPSETRPRPRDLICKRHRRHIELMTILSEKRISKMLAKFTNLKRVISPRLRKQRTVRRAKRLQKLFLDHKMGVLESTEFVSPVDALANRVVLRGVSIEKHVVCPPYTSTHCNIRIGKTKKFISHLSEIQLGTNHYGNISFNWSKGITESSLALLEKYQFPDKYAILPHIRPTPKLAEPCQRQLTFKDIAKYWVLPEGMTLEDILPPPNSHEAMSSTAESRDMLVDL